MIQRQGSLIASITFAKRKAPNFSLELVLELARADAYGFFGQLYLFYILFLTTRRALVIGFAIFKIYDHRRYFMRYLHN